MPKVLLISADTVGPQMAGPAIRYWEFARALSREAEVLLAIPNTSAVEADGFRVVQYHPRSIHDLVRWGDVLITQGFRFPISALRLTRKPVVIDLYDPIPLELVEHYRDRPAREALFAQRYVATRLQHLLRVGDLFLCTGARQRDFWLGMLAAAGRLNWHTAQDDPLFQRLVAVVPFGLPAEPPRPTRPSRFREAWPGLKPSDRLLLWGGGVWEWLDPLTVIRAMALVAAKREDVKLLFMGVQHPNPDIPRMTMLDKAVELARSLELYDRAVFFNFGWLPYAERQGALLEADLGVSAHPDHIEARFAFRTRLLDYFWAGLPVLCTRGDDLADQVAARGAGRVLEPGDVNGWAEAILKLVDDPDLLERCRAASREFAAELTWDQVVAPLREFCRDPRPAPDRVRRSRLADLAALGAYVGQVGGIALRYGGVRKIWQRLRRR